MEKSQSGTAFGRIMAAFAAFANFWNPSKHHGKSSLNDSFYQSYRDRGRQRFGFAIHPWMRKPKR